jgi:hypothetical protein
MTMFSKSIPFAGLIDVSPTVEQSALTRQAQHEIERLTESIFYRKSSLRYKSVLMVDLGGNTSSLWVATGVASLLGKARHSMVHVLAVEGKASEISHSSEEGELDPGAGTCVLERISDSASTMAGRSLLTDRLSAIRADGLMAVVHLSQLREQAINRSCVEFVDGVILLVRAAQTRRAALGMIEKQMEMSRTPLLGSVLLDRDYPIPENLYRLL